MFYYILTPFSTSLAFIYKSDTKLPKNALVDIVLKGRKNCALALQEANEYIKILDEDNISCAYDFYINHNGILKSICKKEVVFKPNIAMYNGFYISKEQMDFALFISKYYICDLPKTLSIFVPFRENIEQVVAKEHTFKQTTLSQEQQNALSFLQANNVSLLFGDTGSGKSEIYFKLIEQAIKKGQSAIFLLPEISLTPQFKKRLQGHFGDIVDIWHSQLTKKTKEKVLQKIHSKEIKIIAGARSALFLPLTNTGIIIIDEEHDDAYKSQNNPKYNARDIAIWFGKANKAKVVLGSATPSLGSFVNYPYFRLKGRYFSSSKNIFFQNNNSYLSEFVINKIQEKLDKNEQIIIFAPTKANFKYLVCKSCSSGVKCPFCSISLSLYTNKRALICNYCKYTQAIPSVCPNCKQDELSALREGTSEIADNLQNIFKDAKISIFDREKIKNQKDLTKTLKSFNDNKINILVGTQMIAKGHDYHNVSLSIIIGADYLLNNADFRAREKALSLIFQVAGRSGRKKDGEVIIQSANEHFIKHYLNDYEKVLQDEVQYRKPLYPPFCKFLMINFAHIDIGKIEFAMNKILDKLKVLDIDIVGYGKSHIEKIANKWRLFILLRDKSSLKLIKAGLIAKGIYLNVSLDMDPINIR